MPVLAVTDDRYGLLGPQLERNTNSPLGRCIDRSALATSLAGLVRSIHARLAEPAAAFGVAPCDGRRGSFVAACSLQLVSTQRYSLLVARCLRGGR